MGRVGFNYPIFLTLIHYATAWVLLAIFKGLSLLPASPPSKSTPFSSLFSLGAVMAFASGLANTSLKHNRSLPYPTTIFVLLFSVSSLGLPHSALVQCWFLPDGENCRHSNHRCSRIHSFPKDDIV